MYVSPLILVMGIAESRCCCCLEDLAMLHIFLTCLMGVVIADLVGRMLLATGTVAEP